MDNLIAAVRLSLTNLEKSADAFRTPQFRQFSLTLNAALMALAARATAPKA